MSEIILYTTDDGRSQIKLRAKDKTVWLSQRQMAQLFDVSSDNVGLHLKNIFEDGELNRQSTTEESSVVQIEGNREVQRQVTLYNLEAILAVGYRVRSPRGRRDRHPKPLGCNLSSTCRVACQKQKRDAHWGALPEV
jgi:hypothetical protein